MSLNISPGMITPQWDPKAIRSRRSLWVASALSAIGVSLFALSLHQQFGNVPLVSYAWIHVALSTIVFAWAFLHRALRQRQVIPLLLIIALPFYFTIWANHVLLAESNLLWAPFLGLKVIVVALAITNPGPYWLGLLLLGGFALESVILWFQLNLGSLPSGVVAGEPWFTAMFIAVSAGLILFRGRQEALERHLLAAELRAKLLSRVAHFFLQVRDQANTPLQHLTLAVELLDQGASTPQEQAEGMRRALHRLNELNQSFSQFNELVQWDGDELDAAKSLTDQIKDVERQFLKAHASK